MKQNTTRAGARAALKATLLPALALLCLALLPGAARAQWATSGDNINSTNTGNVGVGTGTTAPAAKLEVRSDANNVVAPAFSLLNLGANAAGGAGASISFMHKRDTGEVENTARIFATSVASGGYVRGGRLQFVTRGNPEGFDINVMTLNEFGNVGVGTTSPAYRLDVAGSINASGLCLGGSCKSSWAEVSGGGGGQWAGGTSGPISYGGGNVGVGVASPAARLHVGGQADNLFQVVSTGTAATDTVAHFAGGGGSVSILTVKGDGKVGIGTATPGANLADPNVKLDVAGSINVSGNISAKYQDVAEWVPSVQKLAPGTVVVLDTGRTNHVLASSTVYDTKVAGVVSAEPGVILGVGGEGKVKVATTGRVKVRVDATRGAIKVGDLLVTSGVEGVAMKSIPVDLGGTPIHRPGTIIGKALEPLESGTGEILVLLSLQ